MTSCLYPSLMDYYSFEKDISSEDVSNIKPNSGTMLNVKY